MFIKEKKDDKSKSKAAVAAFGVGVLVFFTISSLNKNTADRALRNRSDLKIETRPMTADTSKAQSSSFDQIVQVSYAISSEPKETERKRFELSEWGDKTTGGLQSEDRVLLAKIYSEAESVFEFGLGESPVLANHVGVPRYVGVDSDPTYIAYVREKVSPHFRFMWADIGKIGKWGRPEDKKLPKNVYNYQIAPLLTEHKAFDVYMVDGRWRLPSMMSSFLHASARRNAGQDLAHDETFDTHTTVILHDCFQDGFSPSDKADNKAWNREIYRAADHLLDLVSHSGKRMCVYKRKPTTSDQDLLDMWMENYDQSE